VLASINKDISNYYIISYITPNNRAEGKFRKVTVKVKNSAFKLRTRRGYFEPKLFAKMDVREKYVHLMEGFFRSNPVNELEAHSSVFFLPVNASDVVGAIALEIPADQLGSKGDLSLEMVGSVTDRSYQRTDAFHKKIDYGKHLKQIRTDGRLSCKLPMLFRAGYNRLRLTVRDNATGKRFYVFDEYLLEGIKPDELFISSVVLFDERVTASSVEKYKLKATDLSEKSGLSGYNVPDPLRAAIGRPFFPHVNFEFDKEDQPVVFFSAGNFWEDEQTQQVDFFIIYHAIDSKGREIMLPVVKEKLFPVLGANRINVLSQLRLDELQPGAYQLRVRFLDRKKTQGVQRLVPITIK